MNPRSAIRLARRCFAVAAPYGRRKMFMVLGLVVANAFMQVVGVTSVFPFLALASDPQRIYQSRLGAQVMQFIPEMSSAALLIWAGVLSILLLLAANLFSLIGEVTRMRYAHGLGHYLRMQMMQSFARRPYGYFLDRNSGALLQKLLGDVMNFINGVFLPLLEAISRLITISFLLLLVFWVQPTIAIGAAVLFGLFYGAAFALLRKRSQKLGEGLKEANRETYVCAQQFLGGIKPILVHGKTSHFLDRYGRHSLSQSKLFPWVPIYSNTPRYLIEPVLFSGLVLVVLWFAAQGRIFTDLLPNLTVMALAAYRMLPSVQLLFSQLTQISAMAYVLGELETELGQIRSLPEQRDSSQMPRASIPFDHAIRLDGITFSYPQGRRPVLDHLHLTIPKNASIGIIGTTGSGKSTLVDLLLGLHQPQAGQILVDDRALTAADFPAWRQLIGYVPQEIYLLDASVTENIAFGWPRDQVDPAALRRAAAAAHILEFIEHELPQKWDTVVGERGVRLSGGQRQRIGLARALYHNPSILILDEATSALDTATETEVMRAIAELQGTITILTIAHRLSTLDQCDQIIQLDPKSREDALTT